MNRGRLRLYLGAAPGVGKTHAMLEEGVRRRSRGADVVIGVVETHQRPALADLAAALEQAPTLTGPSGRPELDITSLLARRPTVVLIDDLAHPLDEHHQRWQDVDTLLQQGIDVISTVDIDAVLSLHQVVAGITGHAPLATVPDPILRSAAQIELVDMSPEALRRRLAHGHIYAPEEVDTTVANRFRPEVLGALRQLSLLWLAERVEWENTQRLVPEATVEPADGRERVIVALGGEGGERLVRRGALIAGRIGAELIGVHVVSTGREPGPQLELQRQLLTGLGGVYREVLGDDVADTLASFARIEQATQLVLGARADGAGNPIVAALIGSIGGTDLHVVSTEASPVVAPASSVRAAPVRRPLKLRIAAWSICLIGLPLLTVALSASRAHVSVGSALMFDLCAVMATAALGGLRVGLVASVAAFGLTNWFLTPPLHTLTVRETQNVVALSVFVLVTIVVSVLVDRAARRSREAASSRAEATALARSAATLVGVVDPLPDLLEQLRATFGLAAASVLQRSDTGWWPAHVSGSPPLLDPGEGTSIDISADGTQRLVVSADALRPEQLQVLRAFTDQLAIAMQARQLRNEAADAALLAESNALRTALLRAVSHDFRTPLATIKAASSGLLLTDADFSASDRRLLLHDIDDAADRLDRMVRDLLDMSRLQSGAVDLLLRPTALEEVVAAALAGVPGAASSVRVDVSDALPMVLVDSALLERALANLVSNALAWSPDGAIVRVEAGQVASSIDVRIVDRGPGVAPDDRERIFLPFQRLGDRSNDAGVGLGLPIAKGFVEAMGARLTLEDTPGGGLTITIRLQAADEEEGHDPHIGR